MTAFLYIVLVAVCSFFVYNIFDKLKRYCIIEEFNSRFLELVFILLLGFILAGIILFFFKYIAIPLILIIMVYLIATRKKY